MMVQGFPQKQSAAGCRSWSDLFRRFPELDLSNLFPDQGFSAGLWNSDAAGQFFDLKQGMRTV